MYGGDGWMWGGWGWVGWTLMALAMVLFWALVIAGIVLAVRYVTAGGSPRPHANSGSPRAAEHVLAERFARGEIDDDEYRKRMTTLREHQ
ncbi:SHOCT domain-containing protein [Mycolicibacterium moriokaense]|nr:SHOCT domain-containing protein [Mycolicibacterium moriokaense]